MSFSRRRWWASVPPRTLAVMSSTRRTQVFIVDDSASIRVRLVEMLGRLAPRNLVVAAVPDQLHYSVVMEALRRDQHVLCVKPLVLEHRQAVEIAAESRKRGLLVGKGGFYGNVIRMSPPLNISKTDVDEAARILDESFSAVKQ